jgi:hypothetical protein
MGGSSQEGRGSQEKRDIQIHYPPTLVHGVGGGRARREGERSWGGQMELLSSQQTRRPSGIWLYSRPCSPAARTGKVIFLTQLGGTPLRTRW